MPPDKAAKQQGIVAAATRDRLKAEKQPPRAAEKAAKRQKQPPRAAKGFNLVCASLLSVCAASRFAKPRNFLKKVLIVAVRKCHCGALIRGLQNLDALCKGDVFRAFCVVQKEPKSTPEVCEPLDSGDDSNRRSIRDFSEVTGIHQVTGNAENSSFPGIAGNDLNRCEVPALQHKEFTQTAKEQPHSLQTVG